MSLKTTKYPFPTVSICLSTNLQIDTRNISVQKKISLQQMLTLKRIRAKLIHACINQNIKHSVVCSSAARSCGIRFICPILV